MLHVITDKIVNSKEPFPDFINVYTIINEMGIVVFRTTDSDECAKHLSMKSRAELRNK